MMPRWLVKTIVVLVALFVLVVDGASPIIIRVQLDADATDAASEGARTAVRTKSRDRARTVIAEALEPKSIEIVELDIASDGAVDLTVAKRAGALVLDRIGFLKDWYDVEVSVTADPVD